ncbi:MAG: lipoprotein-releasing ABC transporter permease subunit [Alphaproteobacteria bacterium]|nr:lipoprotein-releasing ABC transporter permease subunit [Alphaproteobacteria bacterium]MBV9372648.1 lipoprotein-releasing ABC transporter permease subunit [Alphaproteobacteria bacterium]MBV9900155.1 lipoprotein-releasing ABC transporter permease subunit [Alphaproteobacteria bacterium]
MILSRYERMIARRYLLPGKGEGFIFLVASISLIAVTLGVAALIVVMSVMNGFRAELFDKIVGLNGHAVVQGYGGRLQNWREIVAQARRTPGVTSAIPMVEQPLMASYDGRVEGVLLRGMQRGDILGNPTLQGKVLQGSLASLRPGSGKVAIGARLAEQLGATIGGEISLITPEGRTTPFGTVPRIVSYQVAAVFEVGVYDYDKAFVIMPIEDAQNFLMLGDSVGMVELQTSDADKVQDIVAPLQAAVAGQGMVTDWRSLNASLFEALQVERVVMFVILSIIILVAVFNILSSLIMLVRAKTRDIAILRTMGATRRGLMKVFMTVGVTIGVLGIVAGLVLGAVLLYFRQGVVNLVQNLSGQNLWDPSIRFLTELPAKTDPFEVLAIVSMALVFSFLATLYPAWKAASTDPVQVLRYE